jgi:cell pole-organizing protein PopZ
MSEQAAPEPTMEEILASIRRIISEDDAPAGEAEAAPVSAPEPMAEPVAAAPAPEPEPPADDVLELTQRVTPEPETVGDIEAYAEPAPPPKPEPVRVAPARAVIEEEEDPLMSEPSTIAAASAFSQLSSAIAMPAAGRTLEDLTRELLRPLLKAWLDENLPRIVEGKVAEEVERIARIRVR